MAAFHVMADAHGMLMQPAVRRITTHDVWDALRLGVEDFWAKPSHYAFLCIIYPIVGVILARWTTSGVDAIHMVYPLMSGFALLGPFAAIGLYEISRRRELGLDSSWKHALAVLRSPALPSIVVMACCWWPCSLPGFSPPSPSMRPYRRPGAGLHFRFLSEVLSTDRAGS